MENKSEEQPVKEPVLEEPELVSMTWSGFALEFENKFKYQMTSFDCFHTGTTTTVRKSTIRMTKQRENLALVMQIDTGKFVVAISKAQGCDETLGLDPKFLGWARFYDGPFYGETWQQLDTDIEKHYREVRGEESDEDEVDETEHPDQALVSHFQWKPLTMRLRLDTEKGEKGEWSYVYTISEEEYTLLNKGAQWMQKGNLKTWNPPRAKPSKQDKKVELHWMWFNGNALHFCDQDNQEYSILFGELVCRRHNGAETAEEPIWMDNKDNKGMQTPSLKGGIPPA